MAEIEANKRYYLGDGLYASFDGFQVSLLTERYGIEHWVALERSVMVALEEFVKELRRMGW